MIPQTGDTVEVRYAGEYSHRGGHKTTATTAAGWHMTLVGGKVAAAPPNATITVLHPYEPPEPPPRSIVRDRVTGATWMRVGPEDEFGPLAGVPYAMGTARWASIDAPHLTYAKWRSMVAATNRGSDLEVYLPSACWTNSAARRHAGEAVG